MRCLGTLSLLLAMAQAFAQEVSPKQSAINKGREYLFQAWPSLTSRGEQSLVVLTLSKSGSTADEPRFAAMVDTLARTVDAGSYRPQSPAGQDNYEAAVLIMALASADREKYRPQIRVVGQFLVDKQFPHGSWDYLGGGTGDTSQSQYALLGLWEASASGLEIPLETWDKAFHWHITRQDLAGGFAYHPTAPPGEARIAQMNVQHSTTVGGVFSMAVCQSNLQLGKTGIGRAVSDAGDLALLIPVDPAEGEEAKSTYTPQVKRSDAEEAVRLGIQWVNQHFTIEKPVGPHYYYLYGVERLGAILNQSTFGSVDWYKAGSAFLISKQSPDGSWAGTYPGPVETSFAVLFLSKSTEKSIEKIRISRLNEATMSGGVGIPKADGTPPEYVLRQKEKYRGALATGVDEILKQITEDSGDGVDESAAAVIESARPQLIIQSLVKNRAGLRRMVRHPYPAVREAGLWGMARLRDYRFAPLMIEALRDEEPSVYLAARDSLRFLARRVEAEPLPDTPPPKAELEKGIKNWQNWFNSLQVVVEPEQEYDVNR